MGVAEDESLFRDLVRKARGDEALARRWLRDICGTDRPLPADTIPAPRAYPPLPSDAQDAEDSCVAVNDLRPTSPATLRPLSGDGTTLFLSSCPKIVSLP